MSDNFNDVFLNTLKLEGGKTVDTGGVTNMGVTQSAWDAYSATNKIPRESVNSLKVGEVKKFYRDEYWDKPKISSIPSPKVASLVFDYGVNAGTGTAIKALQEVVGVKQDGKLGKRTIEAINSYIEDMGEETLAQSLLGQRQQYYDTLVFQDPNKYSPYRDGWSNRIEKLKAMYEIQ